jgi:uncharacterized protein YjeT (DUF2065 family)
MDDLWAALGLVLAIEGALYALFPSGMRRVVAEVLQQPDERLRRFGLVAAAIGVGVVWLVRG